MKRKISPFYLLSFATICFLVAFACNKLDYSGIQSKNIEAITWLKDSGGNYKTGTMAMRLPDSSLIIGKLDWNKRTDYSVNDIDYLEVPFIFEKGMENIPSGNGGYLRFHIVMRKVANGGYEAALQTTQTNTLLTNEENGTKITSDIQKYTTLTGEPLNAYMRNKGEVRPKAIGIAPAKAGATKIKVYSLFPHITASGGSKTMVAAPPAAPVVSCYTYYWTEVVDDGMIFTPSDDGTMSVPIATSHTELESATICTTTGTTDDGSDPGVHPIGGGGGGGTPSFPPNIPPDNPPQPDPCAKAKEAAQKIADALNDPKIQAQLEKFIADYKNSSIEHGFAITKNADGTYGFTETLSGTDNHVNWSFDANTDVVAIIHVHPPGMSAAPSPTDIYGLNDFNNADFAGDIIISGNDRYMVSVTDADKYNKFVSKKDKYYDATTQSQWKYKSSISKSYYNFINNAKGIYTQGTDLTFPTQLYLMKDFNMGVSLQQWNSSTNSFSPIATDAEYNNSSGSSTTLGSGGQTISSPYSSITITVSCN